MMMMMTGDVVNEHLPNPAPPLDALNTIQKMQKACCFHVTPSYARNFGAIGSCVIFDCPGITGHC